MPVELRPGQTLAGLAAVASNRGDYEEVARLRGEVTLNRLRKFLRTHSPLVEGQEDIAHALIDEAVAEQRGAKR